MKSILIAMFIFLLSLNTFASSRQISCILKAQIGINGDDTGRYQELAKVTRDFRFDRGPISLVGIKERVAYFKVDFSVDGAVEVLIEDLSTHRRSSSYLVGLDINKEFITVGGSLDAGSLLLNCKSAAK